MIDQELQFVDHNIVLLLR